MDAIDIGHLIYLVLLLAMVAGWFFAQRREQLNKTAQQAAVWGLIFLGTIAAIGLWDDIRGTVAGRQVHFENGDTVVVPRAPNGHYHLTLDINGAPVDFILDTGASDIVLTSEDAARAGIDIAALHFIGRASTANGVVRTAPVRLDTVTLGPVTNTGVSALVNEGDMAESLLGMGYLQHWGRIEIEGGELRLIR